MHVRRQRPGDEVGERLSWRSLRLRSKKNRYRRPPAAGGAATSCLSRVVLPLPGRPTISRFPPPPPAARAVRGRPRPRRPSISPDCSSAASRSPSIGTAGASSGGYSAATSARCRPQSTKSVHEPVVGHHLAVRPAASGGRSPPSCVQDQEPGRAGAARSAAASRPAAASARAGFAGVPAEQQLHVLDAQPAFAGEQQVDGVLRQLAAGWPAGSPASRTARPGIPLSPRRRGRAGGRAG